MVDKVISSFHSSFAKSLSNDEMLSGGLCCVSTMSSSLGREFSLIRLLNTWIRKEFYEAIIVESSVKIY